MNFNIVETTENRFSEAGKEWKYAAKFSGKNKIINSDGQLALDTDGQKYILKEKRERHYTPFELLKRKFLAITLMAGTFGILGLSNRVKSLYNQKKETIRLATPAKKMLVEKSQKQFSKLIIPEKSLDNLSEAFKNAIQNRNHQTIRLTQSHSFKIQRLYFLLNYNFDDNKKMMRILNNSLPDLVLTGFIQNLRSYKKFSSPEDKKALELIIKKFEEANIIATMVVSIIHTPSAIRKELFRQELCGYLMQRASTLKNGEELLIPSGYFLGDIFNPRSVFQNATYGHSILIALKKEKDSFTAEIFNTGFGSERHRTVNPTTLLPIIYDLGKFNSKEQAVFFDNMTSFIHRPEAPLTSSKNGINEEFYALFKNYTQLEASKEVSYDAQKIANCTHQCLIAYLSPQFPSSETSSSFGFRNFQIQVIEQLRNNLLSYLESGKKHSSYKHPLFPKEVKHTSFLEMLQLKFILQSNGLQISEHKKNIRFKISEDMLQTLTSEADSKITVLNWFQQNEI